MHALDSVGTVERSLAQLLSCFNEEMTALEVEILQRARYAAQGDADGTGCWELWMRVTRAHEAARAAVRTVHEQVEQLLSHEEPSGSLADTLERVPRTLGAVCDALDGAFGVSRAGGPLAVLAAELCGTADRERERHRLQSSLESAKADAVCAVGELCLCVAVGGTARTLAA